MLQPSFRGHPEVVPVINIYLCVTDSVGNSRVLCVKVFSSPQRLSFSVEQAIQAKKTFRYMAFFLVSCLYDGGHLVSFGKSYVLWHTLDHFEKIAKKIPHDFRTSLGAGRWQRRTRTVGVWALSKQFFCTLTFTFSFDCLWFWLWGSIVIW